jgi:hypothetical protein
MKKLTIFLMLLAPFAARADNDLYGRIAQRLAKDPALAARLGHPAPEMKQVAWMIGDWDIATEAEGKDAGHGESHVMPILGGTWLEIRDTYPQGNQDITYITFNPATKRWVSLTIDALGTAAASTGEEWDGDTLVMSGDVVVVGEAATLRQTVTRESDRAYSIGNEERMPDGTWKHLDTYRYTRRREQ